MEKDTNTLTRLGLAEAIQAEFEVNKFDASEIVETVLEQIETALISEKTVKIAGFGTFFVRHKKERLGRNPKTLKEAVIVSRNALSFKPSPIFKAVLNGSNGTENE